MCKHDEVSTGHVPRRVRSNGNTRNSSRWSVLVLFHVLLKVKNDDTVSCRYQQGIGLTNRSTVEMYVTKMTSEKQTYVDDENSEQTCVSICVYVCVYNN